MLFGYLRDILGIKLGCGNWHNCAVALSVVGCGVGFCLFIFYVLVLGFFVSLYL